MSADGPEARQRAAPLVRLLADPDVRAGLNQVLDDAIIAAVPEFGADPSIRADLRASSLGVFRDYVDQFTGEPVTAAPVELRAFGRTLARRGMDAGPVLRAFRVGQRVVWQTIMDLSLGVEKDEQARHELLSVVWDYLTRTLDAGVEEVVASHAEESTRLWRGTTARRFQVVSSILAGEATDDDRASDELGYRVRDRHLGVVGWCGDETPADLAIESLESAVRTAAEVLGAGSPLSLITGSRSLWSWIPVTTDPTPEQLRKWAAQLSVDARFTVGVAASGTAGFRSTHHQAVEAQRVAVRSRRRLPVTAFADVELVSLMQRDERAMRGLVKRHLVGLASDSADVTRLRETVRVYLETGSSGRAAQALNVHKNTVLYRLSQAEALLGHPVTQQGPELHAALLAADVLGSSAWASDEPDD